jgi:ATP-binding cassette subfamily C protein
VLFDVSISIQPGEFVALVGPSGSGKSTLLRLLLGFDKPDSGAVYFDSQNLADLDGRIVRSMIGTVNQSGSLLPGDIFTNITGGDPRFTITDATVAASLVGLDEDIKGMPMGMHTVLGEGSSTLSGGQRQRIMIARAIIRRPKILMLDEATSALDNHTQAVVQRSLEVLKVTRVLIAHRLSTVRGADRVIVLNAGRVVQSGSYDELAAVDGPFRDMVQRQTA